MKSFNMLNLSYYDTSILMVFAGIELKPFVLLDLEGHKLVKSSYDIDSLKPNNNETILIYLKDGWTECEKHDLIDLYGNSSIQSTEILKRGN